MPDVSLLGPDCRRAILERLVGDPAREVHLRELVRVTGFAPRSVQVEVARLVAAGLLTERRDGNRRYLRANKRHPLFRAVREIVRVTHTAAASGASQGIPSRPPQLGNTLAAHRRRIARLCRRYHVRRLDLVGSAARADFDAGQSDIDLVVEFGPDPGRSALDAYFGLKEELEALVGRRVDLIVAGAVTNPYVRDDLDRGRTNVYAA